MCVREINHKGNKDKGGKMNLKEGEKETPGGKLFVLLQIALLAPSNPLQRRVIQGAVLIRS